MKSFRWDGEKLVEWAPPVRFRDRAYYKELDPEFYPDATFRILTRTEWAIPRLARPWPRFVVWTLPGTKVNDPAIARALEGFA